MKRHLVIGSKGEVGAALLTVLRSGDVDEVDGIDVAPETFPRPSSYDFLHVAIPWSAAFVATVEEYAREYLVAGGIVVVHSSVPVGTCEKLGPDYVHSAIRGVHPNLEAGVRTFVKYFGGHRAQEAADVFTARGVPAVVRPRAVDVEHGKLWDTTAYGLMLLLEKVVRADCAEKGTDFDFVYREWTESYNDGYERLGMGHVRRPVLRHVPGRIGGHCVIPNAKILENWLADLLVQTDAELFAEEGKDV